ncbi:Tol-Pal system protein TolB [subsurface metagenome]
MERLKTITIIFLLAIGLLVPAALAKPPSVLLREGLYAEETEGDLDAAIKVYERIIINFPRNRPVAAKAQLHIGLCYEKLGLKEAQKAYQKVIDSYPEQTEAVKLANEKLSLLLRAEAVIRKEDKKFNIRKVLVGSDADNCRAVSPDGRYLSYVDYGDNGDLAIYEIATGKKRRLTNQANKGYLTPMECAFYPRWSPDGKQIVYEWYREDDFIDLRIIGIDGSKPRILYSNDEVVWAQTYDWSTDGRQILACFSKKDGPDQIVLVSAADGSVRVIKTFDWHWPQNMNFSPDGRYIVYDFPQKENSPEHDISLLSTDGSREISLVRHPADDYVLGWAPDGENILFASDRTVTLSAWLIAVADGKPQGAPKLVKPDIIRRFDPLGFTRDGSFYYGYGGGKAGRGKKQCDVYIAKLDPETGKILIPPKKAIKRFEGFNRAPTYSPDGKYLAYVSSRRTMPFISPSAQPNVLCIRSLETGQERVLLPKLKNFASGCWSLDCRSFRVGGLDNKDRRGIFQIDAQTGDVITPIMISDEHKGVYSCQWSRDGKTLFYVSNDVKAELAQIFIRDLETGIEKVLYHAPIKETLRFAISPSPDGNWLAFINFNVFGYYNTTRRGKRVLKIMPAAGGEPRELYTFVHNWNNRPIPITWTADGKYILFLREKSNKDAPKWELCRISAEGGEPQKLGLEVTRSGFYSPSVHPDGQHIAFQSTTRAPAEVWVMENFLPESTAGK